MDVSKSVVSRDGIDTADRGKPAVEYEYELPVLQVYCHA